jgi:hypothetical protein
VTYVGQSYPRLQADAAGALLCDMVNSFIWSKADWRVSLETMTPFYLVSQQQDYTAPALTLPTDFLGLRSAILISNLNDPPIIYPPLHIKRFLQKTTVQSRPTSISYEAAIQGFRVFPRSPSAIGVMDYQIECTYKKNPVKVTVSTLMNTLPFDDQYFPVYVEGMKYFLKPPAAQSDADLMRFLASIETMAAHEAVNLGTSDLAPAEPLVNW